MTLHPARLGENRGFSLVEVLAATVLMGAILAALATITGQWLPNWNRGFAAAQRMELLALGLERIGDDIASAEFIPAGGAGTPPVFLGTERSLMFVRTLVGPGNAPGLELVRIAEVESDGFSLVRSRAPYMPATSGQKREPNWSDPVVLIRSPYRISFAFSAADRVWQSTWKDAKRLPQAVRITVSASGQVLPFSTSIRVHAELPAACVGSKSPAACLNNEEPTEKPGEPELPAKRSELTPADRGLS
jgi:general secretion pathway protein J